MKQIGIIQEVLSEGNILILFKRRSACSQCNACAGADSKDQSLVVKNIIGAKIGDYVEVELNPRSFLHAVIILYIVPLIAFITGISLGSVINIGLNKTLMGALLGFISAFIAYIGISKYDKRISKDERYAPKLTGFAENSDFLCLNEIDD